MIFIPLWSKNKGTTKLIGMKYSPTLTQLHKWYFVTTRVYISND